jgi:hypothetical protein
MLPRRFRKSALWAAVLIFVVTPLAGAEPQTAAAPPDVLHVNGIGSPLIPLDGSWQFRTGDDPAWASPALDDSAWEPIGADKAWGSQTHPGYTGRAWYRRHIEFHPAPGADSDIALYMPIVRDACEVYWNGRLVGGFGKLPPHAVWFYDSVWPFTLGLGHATSGVLAIRVWKAPYDAYGDPASGGLEAAPLAGSPESVANAVAAHDYRWFRTAQFSIFLDVLYALTAALSFLIWLGDRRQRILAWMAVYAIGPLSTFILDNLPLFLPYRYDYGLLFLAFASTEIALWYLLIELVELDSHPRIPRITAILAGILIACALVQLVLHLLNWETGPTRLYLAGDYACAIVTDIVDLYPIVFIPFAFKRRLGIAGSILAVFAMVNQIVQILPSIFSQGAQYINFHALDPFLNFTLHLGSSEIGIQDIGNAVLFLSIVYALINYLLRSRSRQQELETEFRSARELQQFLIPEALPDVPGFALTSAYVPAREVGGDFFQILPLDSGATLIVLGDVSGKGLKAAMAVSLILGTVRALAHTHSAPHALMAELNRRLFGGLGTGFATCAALRVSADGLCTLSSAGHLPPLVNGREISTYGTLPLGIVPEADYDQVEIPLHPGDSLALYTDGLLEARNPAGELYGFERLHDLFATQPTAAQAANAAQLFGQDDDITILTLSRVPAPESVLTNSIEVSETA